MKEFGPHTDEVKALADFVRKGKILNGDFQDPADNAFSTHKITSLSGLQRYRDPDSPGAEIGETAWIDIQQASDGGLLDFASQNDEFTNSTWPKINELARSLWSDIEGSLGVLLPRHELDEIWNDVESFLLLIAAFGKMDSGTLRAYEFSVYKNDGYPCGWKGEFPEGQLVVFHR